MDTITQYLLAAPLWLQIPVVMVIAVPLATIAAIVLVRVVDTVTLAVEIAWQQLSSSGENPTKENHGEPRGTA